MKWKNEDGSTLEVSYLSKRMWYLILGLLLILVIVTLVNISMILYGFYWIDKNNVLSNMMEILKGCG